MFAAVHSDRSGRIVLASDYGAAAFDGARSVQLASAVALPDGAELIPLAGRTALGLDRAGNVRPLGAGRFAVAAVLPPGHLRLAHPAYRAAADAGQLEPRAYAAVAADERGELVVAARRIDDQAGGADHRADPSLAARITEGLRERPSNRAVRQLARCAREYRCRAAANAFLALSDAAIPVAAPSNEDPPQLVSLHGDADASPSERAKFTPEPDEIADVAAAHLAAGGTLVAFGRACEGEPLLAARTLEPAIAAIRARTGRGTIHMESNGSVPAAVARLANAGLDSIAVCVASARSQTYELIHGPVGYRLSDVRASLAEAVAAKIAVALLLLALPGLCDRERELDAIVALAGELPAGSDLLLRDLGADPGAAAEIVPSAEPPLGMDRFVDRLRSEAGHLRIGTIVRPLARI